MNDKKIVIPQGMLNAANEGLDRWSGGPNSRVYCVEDRANVARVTLESALLWLSEHPIEPNRKQRVHLSLISTAESGELTSIRSICTEWQRIMFLASDSQTTEAIKDLLWSSHPCITKLDWSLAKYDAAHDSGVAEAYRRGQQSKDKA